jgi:hypothetical protein
VDPDWDVIEAVKMMKKLTHKQFLAYSWLEHMYLIIAIFHIVIVLCITHKYVIQFSSFTRVFYHLTSP